MGGAATALVGDTSSAAFYNPATLAQLEGSSFSAAVGIYKKFDTVYGKNEDITKAPLRVNQGFFRSLPASTGNMILYKEWAVGMSIVVPDYDSFRGDINSTPTNTSTLSFVDESLWVGVAAAKKLENKSSVGITTYYTARNAQRTISDRSYPGGNDFRFFSSDKTQTENTIVFVLGYFSEINDRWSWGISIRPPSFRIAGNGTYFENYTESVGGVTQTSSPIILTDLTSKSHIPAKFALGFFHQWNPQFKLTSDINIYEGYSFADVENDSAKIEYSHRSLVNFALGTEIALLSWLKFRAGVFTNFSAHPEPDSTLQKTQPDRVDQMGFSANGVFFASKNMSYTFGGYFSGGRGHSMQRIDQKYEFISKNQNVFTMLVGSAYYF